MRLWEYLKSEDEEEKRLFIKLAVISFSISCVFSALVTYLLLR